MPFNQEGLKDPFDIDTVSLHSSNPGLNATPASGEVSGAPYARQSISLAAATTGSDGNGLYARRNLSANAVFNLPISSNVDVQFVGYWKGSVYKGYEPVSNPKLFNQSSDTSRSYTLDTDTFIENRNSN